MAHTQSTRRPRRSRGQAWGPTETGCRQSPPLPAGLASVAERNNRYRGELPHGVRNQRFTRQRLGTIPAPMREWRCHHRLGSHSPILLPALGSCCARHPPSLTTRSHNLAPFDEQPWSKLLHEHHVKSRCRCGERGALARAREWHGAAQQHSHTQHSPQGDRDGDRVRDGQNCCHALGTHCPLPAALSPPTAQLLAAASLRTPHSE